MLITAKEFGWSIRAEPKEQPGVRYDEIVDEAI
jgi:hypothetical protein